MAANTSSLEVLLRLRDQMSSGLTTASNALAKFGNVAASVQKGIAGVGTAVQSVGANLSNVGRAFTIFGAAVSGSLALAVRHASQYGEEMTRLSKITGVGVESLQAFGFAASQNEGSLQDVVVGFRFLTRQIEAFKAKTPEAIALFRHLGVEALDASGKARPLDELMLSLADGFAKIKDPAEASNVAMQLFGRGGTSLLPVLKSGSEELRKFIDQSQRLGLVMSNEQIQNLDSMGDAMGIVTQQLQAMGREMVSAMAPGLTQIASGLKEVFGGVINWIRENKELVGNLANNVLVLGTLAAALGGATIAIGAIISAIGGLIGVVGTLLTVVLPVTIALGTLAAVGLATWASLDNNMAKHAEGMIDSANQIGKKQLDLGEIFKTLATVIGDALRFAVDWVFEAAKGFIDWQTVAAKAVYSIIEGFNLLRSIVGEVFSFLGGVIKNFVDNLLSLPKQMKLFVLEARDAVGGIFGLSDEARAEMEKLQKELANLKDPLANIKDEATKAGQAIEGHLLKAGLDTVKAFGQLDKEAEKSKATLTSLQSKIGNFVDASKEKFAELGAAFAKAFGRKPAAEGAAPGAPAPAASTDTGTAESGLTLAQQQQQAAREAELRKRQEEVNARLPGLLKEAGLTLTEDMEKIRDDGLAAGESLEGIFQKIIKIESSKPLSGLRMAMKAVAEQVVDFRSHFSRVFGDMQSSLANAFEGMIAGGRRWKDALKGFFGDLKASFFRMVSEMVAQNVMKSVMGGLLGGLPSLASAAQPMMMGGQQAASLAPAMASTAAAAGGSIGGGIGSGTTVVAPGAAEGGGFNVGLGLASAGTLIGGGLLSAGMQRGSVGMTAAGGALSGAGLGFMVGGPVGAAIGGLAGGIGGFFGGKKANDEAKKAEEAEAAAAEEARRQLEEQKKRAAGLLKTAIQSQLGGGLATPEAADAASRILSGGVTPSDIDALGEGAAGAVLGQAGQIQALAGVQAINVGAPVINVSVGQLGSAYDAQQLAEDLGIQLVSGIQQAAAG